MSCKHVRTQARCALQTLSSLPRVPGCCAGGDIRRSGRLDATACRCSGRAVIAHGLSAWTAVLRARASVDRVARSEVRASWRRRARAGCAAWVDAVGAVNAVCPARGTVASRDFGSLCRANFSSPKFPLKPGLHATSVHRMHVCAAVKLQTRRTDLGRADSQSWAERETFR